MTDSPVSPSFRLAYVPGVTPAKWVRIWNERLPDTPLQLLQVTAAEASDVLRDGAADAGFVRLPVDRTVFSAIPLYTETTVVVVPKDHVVTAAEEVTLEDLADEVVLHPLDDVIGWERPPGEPAFERPATTADAIELVAANIGVLVVPQSLARLHHRRDLTYRPLTDAPQSGIALSWREDATTDLVEDFIGIVRGRTVNSSRGRAQPEPERGQRPERSGGRKPAGTGKGTGRGSSGGARGARGGSRTSGGSKGTGTRRGKPKRRG
ncbi:DNA-binding transcriptional LysR family regulator [Streptomyces sp. SAI-135]|uniref:LysR substrate-binding domain-containing protein n=1 Tax=unclassified Streptomyces TaxID=2593676 RepID=UPI002476B70F|nr:MULTISPECIES: LysR substrate-binding domain-containing protein [unclassified Streptomyces]MDH6520842.1 DNA-binding transcriptional LysR family regulator [Streptomyces sp. SAI-090]MDH6553062.1 DNA-binding transcriptional LysR family regulator [Streptomyces sp. SAI-041]MDH6572144.1 DNA-binding transcriptional LysR family regulator [Streptomyces sp. SAI-117]MDH6615066.1 DNA-binding transcriptional LysR family regulator [Streptomyces sp. SAI-135]